MRSFTLLTCFVIPIAASVQPVAAADVVSGATSVVLDTDLLASAANLNLSSVSDEVTAPGTLPDSVALGINPRDASTLPTSFSYDPATFPALGSFSGTIEHAGSVYFNSDSVEVGNFTIGFDQARAGTLGVNASGFFVESTTGVAAILFDLKVNSADPQAASLTVGADLLVSPEFGGFLLDNGLSSTNLQGADVGDALLEAVAVPEPSGVLLAALGLIGLTARRRRQGLEKQ